MHDMEQEYTDSPMSEDDAAGSSDEEKVKIHSCDQCDKSFTSANALYGHIGGAHSRRCASYSKKKAPVSEPYECVLCHESFPSKHSLRSHLGWCPERKKSPPPQVKIQTPSESEDPVDAGLCVGLKGWGSYDTRGRSPIINPAKEKKNQEKEAGECSKAPEDQDSDSAMSYPFENEVLNKLVHALADMMAKKLDIQKRGAEEEKIRAAEIIKPQRKSSRQINAATSLRRGEYECNECGRLFTTYQGLGGHRRIHNLPNPTAKGGRNPPTSTTKKKSNIVVADAETASSSSSSSSSKSPYVFPFDLNNMPPAEEEVGGCSSSHSSAD